MCRIVRPSWASTRACVKASACGRPLTALGSTTLGRDVGSRTDLDVLNAQQRLFNAQLDPAQARIDYLLGRIRLSAAAGELHDGDLHAINAYLDR